MEIYGHTMLDMGYQFNQNDPDWYDVVRPTKLPSFENEFGDDGNFFASVRQSRLGVKTATPTSYGDLKTIFEFELFGTGADAGQTTFRLRHERPHTHEHNHVHTVAMFVRTALARHAGRQTMPSCSTHGPYAQFRVWLSCCRRRK